MQCIALARGTGERCKNDAEPGSPFCEVVQHNTGRPVAPGCEEELERALEATRPPLGPELEPQEEPAGAPEPDPGPELEAEPDPGPSEPDRADFPDPADPLPSDLEAIPEGPPPELEDVATPPPAPDRDLEELDGLRPGLFSEEEPQGEEELGEDPGPGAPPSPPPRAIPGPHSARQVRKIFVPAVDRTLVAAGLDPLEPEEAESGGEIIALWLNHTWERLDPSNPTHLLGMWLLVVVGSRVAPLAVARVSGRARSALGGRNGDRAPSSSSAEPEAEEPQEDGGPEAPSSWLSGELRP